MTTKAGARKIVKQNGESSFEVAFKEDHNLLPQVESLKDLHTFRPDLVDKAVSMAEKEQQFRHSYIDKQIKDNAYGRRYAFALSVFSIGACVVLGVFGYTVPAVAVCSFPVASMIISFMTRH